MPRVLDNIDVKLLPALNEALAVSFRADMCVGYFNLRGWRHLDTWIDEWDGRRSVCRVLVGMQRGGWEELDALFGLAARRDEIDNATALRKKKEIAAEFRRQLVVGTPTDEDERGLRRLSAQLKAGKVVVKLFLRYPLHAKLYMLFRDDAVNPRIGFLGSSNLTFGGMLGQGELNVDVMEHDASAKLARWFEDRWKDRYALDVSKELAEIIDESWAREEAVPPYHVYLKIAWHLSREARAGVSEFNLPRDFGARLFPFQEAAVKIAAHHVAKRDGVMLGDVVGLGKTIMATALIRILEEQGYNALILCPKNLVEMWEDYRERYGLRWTKVLSLSRVSAELPDLRRYRLIIIDESHNLRNPEGQRYRAIREYVQANESKCVLLSATPYNKTYIDLSSQLKLFIPDDRDLGVRPERLLREIGETEFIRRHQCPVKSLNAFEKSHYADDWRELMRMFLVRRTRSFIQSRYGKTDPASGRRYLEFEDGRRSYFPVRVPRKVPFEVGGNGDQYAFLFNETVIAAVSGLHLPRYGIGNYVLPRPHNPPTQAEAKLLKDLSRAGKRLQGFCRTGLFKRLESSGAAFVASVERHILRNAVVLHAIENGLDIPLGTQDPLLLDTDLTDDDLDFADAEDAEERDVDPPRARMMEEFHRRAAETYEAYARRFNRRFKWISPRLFMKSLANDLLADTQALMGVLNACGTWDPACDHKLTALHDLVARKHPDEKILVFSQFADTVDYLKAQLRARGVSGVEGVTGGSADPTSAAWRFSPVSNGKPAKLGTEIRVLIATDVLSEGQNLQDAAIVVNYDLPWAIIRLIQRAGRVDRIGQQSENILCYSFLPADGVDRIIRLRSRVKQRLQENAEVVGTDESFFEDDDACTVVDLYNEEAGVLDGDDEGEVDLASYAYQIWTSAIEADPSLRKAVEELPDVVYSAKAASAGGPNVPDGALVYMRTAEDNDALAYVDAEGRIVTESQYEILRIAACGPDEPAQERHPRHHELVGIGAVHIVAEEKNLGGQLGRPSGARFRVYERLKAYADSVKGTLFDTPEIARVIDDVYRSPLRQTAVDVLNRQLKAGIENRALYELCAALRDEDRLVVSEEEAERREPRVICSLGIRRT